MNQEVTFHGTPTRKDFHHYYRYHTQRTMYYLSLTVFLLVWLILSVIFMFYGLGLTYTPLEFFFTYSFALCFPVIYALIWYANAWLRSFHDDRESQASIKHVYYEVGPEEIRIQTSNTQAHYRWKDIVFIMNIGICFVCMSRNEEVFSFPSIISIPRSRSDTSVIC